MAAARVFSQHRSPGQVSRTVWCDTAKHMSRMWMISRHTDCAVLTTVGWRPQQRAISPYSTSLGRDLIGTLVVLPRYLAITLGKPGCAVTTLLVACAPSSSSRITRRAGDTKIGQRTARFSERRPPAPDLAYSPVKATDVRILFAPAVSCRKPAVSDRTAREIRIIRSAPLAMSGRCATLMRVM